MVWRLGINTGFAVNRFSEPEDWIPIVGDELGLRTVQFTADLLNPDLPATIRARYTDKIASLAASRGVSVTSTFTGAFTRVNHLSHPDPEVRSYWISWFRRFVDISVDIGASAMGSHFGIFTDSDNRDIDRREERRRQNIRAWHEIGEYARDRGLSFLSWEPMSISREQGETLVETRRLHDDVNRDSPIPFRLCLDVDHGDVSSPNVDDTDPYAWLGTFATETAQVHLKQSKADKGGHWPFIAEHNREGRVHPDRVLATLHEAGCDDADLLLELSFREREPIDSTVVSALKESVAFWRRAVPL